VSRDGRNLCLGSTAISVPYSLTSTFPGHTLNDVDPGGGAKGGWSLILITPVTGTYADFEKLVFEVCIYIEPSLYLPRIFYFFKFSNISFSGEACPSLIAETIFIAEAIWRRELLHANDNHSHRRGDMVRIVCNYEKYTASYFVGS
jgi:hypothetical protein